VSKDLSAQPSAQPRKRARWSRRALGVVIVGVAAGFLLGPALGVVRTIIALAGYLLVGVFSYWIGKWVGRRSAPR
jgi:hypothetical protein